MASIIVCGGSVIGLSTAMLLARDGHDVTVLERDAAPPPTDPRRAWGSWDRKGVAQFHQPHILFPRFRLILEDELPHLVDDLVGAGCVWLDPIAKLPPFIDDRTPRPEDDMFRFVTGRRPAVEAVLARAAEGADGVCVRRGVGVAELVTGDSVIEGVPNVVGVLTTDGQALTGDLVVDATGRRTKLSEWLLAVGGREPRTESEDCGFVYHTRYFTGLAHPEILGPLVSDLGTISLLTLPADNGTWSVTLWTASGDLALKALRNPAPFTNTVRACPLHAHWVDGEPITDVLTMAGILDRYRRFIVDDVPVATGVAAVGDAWACTNPSAGRGMTVGLLHAQRLRDVVRADLHDPERFVRAFDEITETDVAPYYWNQIEADRVRIAQMDALREGREPLPPDPVQSAVEAAMLYDADVFRAALEVMMCWALPQEVYGRPGFMDRVHAVDAPPQRIPGPDRAGLLELMS